ncbi:MAG: hypothetical protein WBN48_10085 [Thiogranum sp.]
MKIDIYKSTKNGNKYLSVPKGTKMESLQLQDPVDRDLLTLSPFKTRLEITPGKSHFALDQDNIIEQIEENGYAIHGAKIEIKVGAVKKKDIWGQRKN